MKWTEKSIREEASKYARKSEFKKGSCGAYSAANKRFPGLLDDIFGKNVEWNERAIREEARRYASKKDFKNHNASAYLAANKRFPGLLDDIFGKGSKWDKWTEQAIREEARRYASKKELDRGSRSAYAAAWKRFPGLLDDIFGKDVKSKWNEQNLREEASRYASKKGFCSGNASAYQTALTRFPGLLDKLFVNQPRYTDADALYIWTVKGMTVKGKRIAKIGITSRRLGNARIKQVALANKVEVDELWMFPVKDAKAAEDTLHGFRLPVPKKLDLKDGKTEFRIVDDITLRGLVAWGSSLAL